MKLVLGRLEGADCSGVERAPRPRSGGRLAVPPRPVSARRPPPHPTLCPPLHRSSASNLGQEGGGSLPSKAVGSQLGCRAAGKGGADHPTLGGLGNGSSPSPIQTPMRIGRWLFLTRTGGTVSQRVVPEPGAERGGGSDTKCERRSARSQLRSLSPSSRSPPSRALHWRREGPALGGSRAGAPTKAPTLFPAPPAKAPSNQGLWTLDASRDPVRTCERAHPGAPATPGFWEPHCRSCSRP